MLMRQQDRLEGRVQNIDEHLNKLESNKTLMKVHFQFRMLCECYQHGGLCYNFVCCNEITLPFLTLGKSKVNVTLTMTGRCSKVKMDLTNDFPTFILNKNSIDSIKLCVC